MRVRGALAAALLALALAAAPVTADAPAPAATSYGASPARSAAMPAVIESRIIGRSVKGRPIRAWRVGEPGKHRVVVLSTMHGDEPATRRILTSLRDGRPVRGVDMWLVPVLNPDGYARGTRKNARGVDLNRNYPFRWANLNGRYQSGRRPASEPETRALMALLKEFRPHHVVSFHQPLYGVDMDTKSRPFARRLADELNLPRDHFDCGGVCHGTMTGWYNHNFAGAAVTVEYGHRPSYRRMTVYAPRQLLRVFGATR